MPYCSIILIIAEPTIAPSDKSAIAFACSGVDIPNPIAHGTEVFCLITSTIDLRSVFISVLMVLPVIYTGTLGGICAADRQLLEMAQVFAVPLGRRLRCVYLPQVMPQFRAACTVALGLCWKAGVAAEVIGMPRGSVGERLQQAKVYLNTPDLFAWTLTVVLLSLMFERLFLALLRALSARLERV